MKEPVYYGTNIQLCGEKLNKIRELGSSNIYHNQFRIVCKAKSMAEANRIASSYGLGDKVFQRNYTSTTKNEIEMKMADSFILIVCLHGTQGDDYINIENITS